MHSGEGIRAFYGAARIEIERDTQRGDRVTVLLHSRPVPRSLPYPVRTVSPNEVLPPSPTRPLSIGLDGRGAPVNLPLFGAAGGTSLLAGGVPGSGKSSLVRVILAGLAPTQTCIVAIDPTGGAEGRLWGRRITQLVSSAEPVPTMTLLREVLALIERRGRILGAGGPIGRFTPVVLVCDELAELAAAGTPKEQDEARTALRRIVALGRKADVSVVLATQRTTSTSIDVTTRSLVAWRLALAHPDDVHGSEALLGPGRREAALLAKSDVGVGYLTNGGTPTMVTVFHLSAEQVGHVVAGCGTSSLEDIASWETASLRELTP